MPASLADLVFWTSVALCAVAQFGILRSVLAPRDAPLPRAGAPTIGRAGEIVWAVVPAIGLAILLAMTWRAIHPSPAATRRQAPPATIVLLAPPAYAPAGGAR